MTKKAFSSVLNYQLKKIWSVPVILISAIIFMNIFIYIVSFSMDAVDDISFEFVTYGLDSMACVIAMILPASTTFDNFNTASANGVSKKTAIISMTCYDAIDSLVTALSAMILMKIGEAVNGAAGSFTVEEFYGSEFDMKLWGTSGVMIDIRNFILIAVSCFLLVSIVRCITSIVYSISKKAGIIFICVIFFLLGAVPNGLNTYYISKGYDITVLVENAYMSIGRVFGFRFANGELTGNAVQGCAVMLLISAVMFGISYVFAKRSAVKPLAIPAE